MSIEVISGFIGLILTLLVFSYLIGDNPLFRFAIYLFIGVSSGYAAFAAWQYVLWPRLFSPFLSQLGNPNLNQLILLAVPLVLKPIAAGKALPAHLVDGEFCDGSPGRRGRGIGSGWGADGNAGTPGRGSHE